MHILFGLVFVVGGIIKIVWPDASFRREERKYKEQREPSEEHLSKERIFGVGCIILGILFITGVFGMVE
jgi:hypothetical protein